MLSTSKAKLLSVAATQIQSTTVGSPPVISGFGYQAAFGPVILSADSCRGATGAGPVTWMDPVLSDYGDVPIPPIAGAVHYGLQAFENIPLIKGEDGSLHLFRPQEHIRLFQQSTLRIAFPTIDEGELFQAVRLVAKRSAEFVPAGPHHRAIIRLLILGCNSTLSALAADRVRLLVSCIAVNSSFEEFPAFVNPSACRAWPGGTGDIQIGANYVNHIFYESAAKRAVGNPRARVLWTGAADPQLNVQQAGDLNVFFKVKSGPVVTPALDGTVLPGVARRTMLELLRASDTRVEERSVPLSEVITLLRDGQMEDIFATGNAPLVARLSQVLQDGQKPLTFSTETKFAETMYAKLMQAQTEDSHGYMMRI